MYRVGLTGGIASGKSQVSNILSDYGAIVVDHDVLARQAVEIGSPGLTAIVAAFGSDMLNDDGSLNRARLGELVFQDKDALNTLNSIVHPEVKRLGQQADAGAEQLGKVVVHDIPLLVETTQQHSFDSVIVVEAPLEQRISRMEQYRGMDAQQALARINNQASDELRRSIADFVIVNDGTIADLEAKVLDVWNHIIDAHNVSGSR